ncbi:MAG: lysophospholipid acyltransferase family protein [Planctomycetes bacterium]|nr:lysophospholipid acyltransferase family protein [Planctomycetota bacterium]
MGISPYRWYRWMIFGEQYIPVPLIYFIARRIADIRRHIDRRGREAVESNMRLILGDDAPKKLIKRHTARVFYQTAAYICEFMGLRRFAPAWLKGDGWKIYNIEYVEKAQAEGRGVLILSAHFSNWEVGGAMLASLGKEVYVTSLEHEDPRITELFNDLRTVWGFVHMPIEKSVKLSMDALRAGKIVCYLGDRALAAAGAIDVDFFGKKVPFPTTPIKMALKANALILPGFIFREGRNFFHLRISDPVEANSSLSLDDNVHRAVQEYASRLEAAIRQDPSQWICYTRIGEEERLF